MGSEPIILDDSDLKLMNSMPVNDNEKQTDYIKNELNFSEVDPEDPLTKASLDDDSVSEWLDILGNSQLQKKVLEPGQKHKRPQKGDMCILHFKGRLEDGTLVEEQEDFEIQLGDGEVVQGLDLAIALMDTGEEAEIKVDPRFAYGDMGRTAEGPFPEIPPKSTIVYTIALEKFEMEPDIELLELSVRRSMGNKKRERGNYWFSRNDLPLAIQSYRRALHFLFPIESDTQKGDAMNNSELQGMLEDSLKVHNNLAAAQLKAQAYDAALGSVENVLRYQPNNVKALFRKGKILHQKGEHAKACLALVHALKIEPENKAIQQELAVLKQKSARDARHEKNLYRKMLGTTVDNSKTAAVKKKSLHSFGLKWGLIGGTVAAIVGLVAYRVAS